MIMIISLSSSPCSSVSSPAEAFPWQSKADKQIRRSVQCWCIQTSRRPFKYWYHIWKLISNVYKTNQSIFSIIEPAEGSLLGLVPPLRDPRPAFKHFVTISTKSKISTNLKTWTVSVLLLQARKAPQGENESEKMEAVLFKPRRSSYSFAPSWQENTLWGFFYEKEINMITEKKINGHGVGRLVSWSPLI